MTTTANSATRFYETQAGDDLIRHMLPAQAIADLRTYGVPDEHTFLVITSLLKYAEALPMRLPYPTASQEHVLAYPMSKRAIWRLIRPE